VARRAASTHPGGRCLAGLSAVDAQRDRPPAVGLREPFWEPSVEDTKRRRATRPDSSSSSMPRRATPGDVPRRIAGAFSATGRGFESCRAHSRKFQVSTLSAGPVIGAHDALRRRRARCGPDDLVFGRSRSFAARLLSASAITCWRCPLPCRYTMAPRVVECPIRSISSCKLAPASAAS
jgi:hypothetical protein